MWAFFEGGATPFSESDSNTSATCQIQIHVRCEHFLKVPSRSLCNSLRFIIIDTCLVVPSSSLDIALVEGIKSFQPKAIARLEPVNFLAAQIL
jgi:hypothetical protein